MTKLFQCDCDHYLQVICNHQNNAISYDILNLHFFLQGFNKDTVNIANIKIKFLLQFKGILLTHLCAL